MDDLSRVTFNVLQVATPHSMTNCRQNCLMIPCYSPVVVLDKWYEGVSKSFRTEYSPSRICNGSSVSATSVSASGTDFLESRVGLSAIVPECQ
jgi:hypothetical protein